MPSVTIAVAAAQGKLDKQADVALEIWRSPDQLRAGVASGQFKVMMSPSNVGVNLRNQGQQVWHGEYSHQWDYAIDVQR